jgi:uncharacterized protein (TIGR03067 family)
VFFRDRIESADQWESYEKLIAGLSHFVNDCVRYLIDAFDVAQVGSVHEQCYSHATVLMLARHVIEAVDGVSVLAERGCAENCGPLLRSAFEGQLGVLYILEAESKRRALSYQVAHVHRKIKAYRKYDPNDPLGRQFRAELKDDPMADVFDRIPGNLQAMIANLESMFTKPEFAPVEQEWKAVRKNKDPEWFALFGGPRDVRSLAFHLKLGAAYEGLYTTEGKFAALAKRLDDVASNLSDSYEVASEGAQAHDQQRKDTFRAMLQQSLVSYAQIILALDEMSAVMKSDWKIKPDVGRPIQFVSLTDVAVSSTVIDKPLAPTRSRSNAVRRNPSPSDDALQGNWRATQMWGNGQQNTNPDFWKKPKTLSVNGKTFVLTLNDGVFRGTLETDAAESPARITFKTVERNGMELRGVYQSSGNDLVICWIICSTASGQGPQRPTTLDPADGVFKFIFQRQEESGKGGGSNKIAKAKRGGPANGPFDILWEGGWEFMLEVNGHDLIIYGEFNPNGEEKMFPKPRVMPFAFDAKTSTAAADQEVAGMTPIHLQWNVATGEASRRNPGTGMNESGKVCPAARGPGDQRPSKR